MDETFLVLVATVIFIALTYRAGRKAITGMLDKRIDSIRTEIDNAQKLREEAQAALAEFQRKARDAETEAAGILAAAKDEAARLKERALADLDAELTRREEQAKLKIEQAEAAALGEVRAQAVDIALAATEAMLHNQLDGRRQNRLIDDAIKDLPGKLN